MPATASNVRLKSVLLTDIAWFTDIAGQSFQSALPDLTHPHARASFIEQVSWDTFHGAGKRAAGAQSFLDQKARRTRAEPFIWRPFAGSPRPIISFELSSQKN